MTVQEIFDYASRTADDVSFAYGDKVIVIYIEDNNVTVDTDDFGLERFKSWNELIESDYFWGQKLKDIAKDIITYDDYIKNTTMH